MEWKRSSFEPHPVGVFEAVFVDWSEEEGQFGTQVALKFDSEAKMKDGQPYRATYWCRPVLNPKSNAYKVLRALGVDVDAVNPETMDEVLDELVSRNAPCQLLFEEYTRADGTKGTKISNVVPAKGRAAAPTSSPARGTKKDSRQPALVGAGHDPFEDE